MTRDEAMALARKHVSNAFPSARKPGEYVGPGGMSMEWLYDAILEAANTGERRTRASADRRREFHAPGFLPDGRSLHRRGPAAWRHVFHINERVGERRKS